jgi:hypothetical protein
VSGTLASRIKLKTERSELLNDGDKLVDVLEKMCPMKHILLMGVPREVCAHCGALAVHFPHYSSPNPKTRAGKGREGFGVKGRKGRGKWEQRGRMRAPGGVGELS